MDAEEEERMLRSAAPESTRSIVASRERTERKLEAAKEALSASNERLQIALNAGRLGDWNWDAATDALTLGTRAAQMFGLAAGVPVSRARMRELLPAEDAERAREALDRALAGHTDYSAEYRVNRATGGQCWVAASGRGLYAEDGTLLGMTGVMQDITAKKAEEQTLREADLRKDEFLATLAHELRNPLAPLRTSLEILRQDRISDETRQSAMAVMMRQVAQMVGLIDDLLDVSRISTGRIELRRERVTLAAVVDSALEISRPLIDARGHHLSLELPPHPVRLEVDGTRIAQVLSNLLNNAAKYTGQHGHIRLSAALDGEDAVISVADSGIGIAPEMLDRVFDMFMQVDRRLERSDGGLGVGLTLARRLAELHGGTLDAHSEGLGRGSRFTLRLKTAPALRDDAQSGAPAAAPQNRLRRVLVVDDNIDQAESLATLLRLGGHEVHTAYDGREGIDAVCAVRPDVVLLDIGMPGLSGYETARRIRAQDEADGITLIAISGWGQPNDRRLSQDSGFDHHMVKPVDPSVLGALLTQERRPAPAHPRRQRVLLVDDNKDVRESLAWILQVTGCEIRSAADGLDALEMARIWRPQVVFLDIHMPRLNGFTAAKQLREQFPRSEMKLVLMSGVSIDDAFVRHARRAGFDACIDKMAGPDLWLRQLEPLPDGEATSAAYRS